MFSIKKLTLASGVLLISSCATLPSGPNVMVLPGTGRTFDQFRIDDTNCEHYAASQVGSKNATPNSSSASNEASGGSTEELQERYDVAYVQCMYAKGHQVPVSGQFSGVIPPATAVTHIPPPPAGSPPPPPTPPTQK